MVVPCVYEDSTVLKVHRASTLQPTSIPPLSLIAIATAPGQCTTAPYYCNHTSTPSADLRFDFAADVLDIREILVLVESQYRVIHPSVDSSYVQRRVNKTEIISSDIATILSSRPSKKGHAHVSRISLAIHLLPDCSKLSRHRAAVDVGLPTSSGTVGGMDPLPFFAV